MSTSYAIIIVLDAQVNESNISKVLTRGFDRGFIYYDHILGQRYEDSPVLTPRLAALKIIKAMEDKIEGGPSVYANIGDTVAYLWFYKTAEGYLEFYIGGFGVPKKKDGYIDFPYYINIFLDLCEDFIVLSVKTETY